jgi:hypothetical protein
MFRLNRNSLIVSIFCYFLQKIRVFRFFRFLRFLKFFFVCFETVCSGCFASIPKQRVLIEPKQTEDPPKQFKKEYIWEFFGKFRVVFGLFWFVTKQICLFRLFDICRFETSKQTNRNFSFWFHPKQTRNRSWFGLFQFKPKFIFVCFEDTLPETPPPCGMW